MPVLRVAATDLSRQYTVVSAVEAPGRRHIGDGVSDEH